MIDPRAKRLAVMLLPGFLTDRLDPVAAVIEGEVREMAVRTEAGQVILDAGAGEARHRAYFKRGRYLALDSAVGDPRWNYSRLDILGDLESIPLRDGSVDGALCMVTLEHMRRPERVLAEIGRVLKPGGELRMVLPFLWEEHQAPHDYFRFTRFGVRALLEPLPFRVEKLDALGGFFRVCARRCINLLGFFQEGWRWPLFFLLAPFFGLLFPLALHALDGLDRRREFTLGYVVRARRERA